MHDGDHAHHGERGDGYSPRCSCTILTARSRTSGENLFVFFVAQSSQSVEPPQIRGDSLPVRDVGVSRQGESHPQLLPDPDVSLSTYPVPVI